ncbi:hypothetical protein [Nocardia heshunensis]
MTELNEDDRAAAIAASRWWEERTDSLLAELRERIEANAEDGTDIYGYFGRLREQSEFDLIIDNLAAVLSGSPIPITGDERDRLRELLFRIDNPNPIFRFIANRDQVLSSLNVISGN